MPDTDRRSFLRATGAAMAGAALGGGCAPGEDTTTGSGTRSRSLPADLLRGVAAVVLPASTLGPEGVEQAVVEFEAWVEGFEPVAELEHGYGTSEIRYGPPHPAPGWAAQLEGLEIESMRRFDTAFTALPAAERRSLVAGHLGGAEGLTDATRAPHVALGLLAHFYDSPAATDLCYGRLIRKETCRGLSGVEALPPALDAGEGSGRPPSPAGGSGGSRTGRSALRMAADHGPIDFTRGS